LHSATKHVECKKLISNFWNDRIVGCHMYILNRKLHIVKEKLKVLIRNYFGSVHNSVKEVEKKIHIIQTRLKQQATQRFWWIKKK